MQTKCDVWLESLHILLKMLKLTDINMWLFILPYIILGDKNYTECTVEFKIKVDNSVNDTAIFDNL